MTKNVFGGDVALVDGDVLNGTEFTNMGLFGDGSDGSYTSGNNLTPGTVYHFTDLTLNSGDTLQLTSSTSEKPVVVKVSGNVDISGTIDLSGQGFAGATTQYTSGDGYNVYGLAAPSQNFSNGAAEISQLGSARHLIDWAGGGPPAAQLSSGALSRNPGDEGYPTNQFLNAELGKFNIAPGTGGGTGKSLTTEDDQAGGSGGASYGADGSSGTEDTNTSVGDGTASGGNGGGAMIILCSGDFSFTGTIDISGQDGSVDSNNACGGGGGAGGMFWAIYDGSLTDSGTKTTSGGAGGNPSNTAASGGSGGNGTILFESVT